MKRKHMLSIVIIVILLIVGLKLLNQSLTNKFVENKIREYLPNAEIEVRNKYTFDVNENSLESSTLYLATDYSTKEVYDLAIDNLVTVYNFTFSEPIIIDGKDLSQEYSELFMTWHNYWGILYVNNKTNEILRFEIVEGSK